MFLLRMWPTTISSITSFLEGKLGKYLRGNPNHQTFNWNIVRATDNRVAPLLEQSPINVCKMVGNFTGILQFASVIRLRWRSSRHLLIDLAKLNLVGRWGRHRSSGHFGFERKRPSALTFQPNNKSAYTGIQDSIKTIPNHIVKDDHSC